MVATTNFDKNQCLCIQHDKIDFAEATAQVAGDETHPLSLQHCCGACFGLGADALAGCPARAVGLFMQARQVCVGFDCMRHDRYASSTSACLGDPTEMLGMIHVIGCRFSGKDDCLSPPP